MRLFQLFVDLDLLQLLADVVVLRFHDPRVFFDQQTFFFLRHVEFELRHFSLEQVRAVLSEEGRDRRAEEIHQRRNIEIVTNLHEFNTLSQSLPLHKGRVFLVYLSHLEQVGAGQRLRNPFWMLILVPLTEFNDLFQLS